MDAGQHTSHCRVPPPVPRRSAHTARLDQARNTKGRMMKFVKRVRSAAFVVLLAGSALGLTGLAATPSARHSIANSAHRQTNLLSHIPPLEPHTHPNSRHACGTATR